MNGSRIGRPRTKTYPLRPAGRACAGRCTSPVTSKGPARCETASSVSASSPPHNACTRSMSRAAGGHSSNTRPSLVTENATSGRVSARTVSASTAARVSVAVARRNFRRVAIAACFQLEARHGGDRGQRFATKSERGDADEIGRRANLARGVTLQGELRILAIHPRTVVAHADQRLAAVLELDPYGVRAGIEGILDELLDDRCGTLDDLAGGNLIGDIPGEQLDARTRDHTHNPAISPPST